MEVNDKMKIANVMRYIARIALLIIGIVVFIFALISGSEGFGGGFTGIIRNSPNALPWLALLLLVFLAWKKELIGGITITVLGLGMIYFFNTGPNFYLATFILTCMITILGLLFIGSWFLRKAI